MRIGIGLSICDVRQVSGGGAPPPAAPSISAIAPDFGTSAGGTAVSITGTGFTDATDATVGGITLDSLVVVDDEEITGVTNAVLEGDEDVVVTGPGGSDTLVNGFEFVDPVDVISISPVLGTSAGGTAVTITCADATGATGATVGGNAITSFTVVNDTTITGVTAAHVEGNTDVVVQGLVGGPDTLTNGYEFVDPPTVSSIAPIVGNSGGGTAITITGVDLTGATGATIGGVAVTSFTVVNDTTATGNTGAHARGAAVDVVVTGQVGTGTLSAAFKYYDHPSLYTLTGWVRADFTASPWVGEASAGASGSRNFSEATNPPAVGTALNSLNPADFDGSNDLLTGNVPTDFVSLSVGGIAVLFNTDTTAAANAVTAWQNDRAIVADSLARIGIVHTNSGVRGCIYNGTARDATASVTCSTGAWHWAFIWWTGGTMYCQVDNGSPVSISIGGSGGPVFAAGTMRIGRNNGGTSFYDGRVEDVIMQNEAFTATQIEDILRYGTARYVLPVSPP